MPEIGFEALTSAVRERIFEAKKSHPQNRIIVTRTDSQPLVNGGWNEQFFCGTDQHTFSAELDLKATVHQPVHQQLESVSRHREAVYPSLVQLEMLNRCQERGDLANHSRYLTVHLFDQDGVVAAHLLPGGRSGVRSSIVRMISPARRLRDFEYGMLLELIKQDSAELEQSRFPRILMGTGQKLDKL